MGERHGWGNPLLSALDPADARAAFSDFSKLVRELIAQLSPGDAVTSGFGGAGFPFFNVYGAR
jgi:hypothetical protein